jgi:hypothetical protein
VAVVEIQSVAQPGTEARVVVHLNGVQQQEQVSLGHLDKVMMAVRTLDLVTVTLVAAVALVVLVVMEMA